jgi:hypothetical protein
MFALFALAAGACSNSTSTASPAAPTPTGTSGPVATGGNGGSSGIAGAAANLSNISSYKFKMTLAGGSFGSLLSMFGSSSTADNVPFTVSGTVVTQPSQAADITLGTFHIIEIGGYDYTDMGTGGFVKLAETGSGLAQSFSPQTLFSSSIDASTANGYSLIGTETKNGVQANHYQASQATLAEFGSILGVTGATWSADVWIAQTGGYPVSVAIVATAADKSLAYEMSFDLSNINDPSNSVTVPTNVSGA